MFKGQWRCLRVNVVKYSIGFLDPVVFLGAPWGSKAASRDFECRSGEAEKWRSGLSCEASSDFPQSLVLQSFQVNKENTSESELHAKRSVNHGSYQHADVI